MRLLEKSNTQLLFNILNEDVPLNYEEKEERLIPTGLTDDKAKDIISAVIGQMSDGLWENSPGMERYWKFASGLDNKGNLVVYNGYERRDFYRGTDRYGVSKYKPHWSYSAFNRMDDTAIKKFYANKIKQIVKEEGLEWNRNNTEPCQYLDYNSGVTVRDAYRVYDKLLGRIDRITEGAPFSHTAKIYYGTTDDGDDIGEINCIVDNSNDFPNISDQDLDDAFENDNLNITNNDLTGEESMLDIKLTDNKGWLEFTGKDEQGNFHFTITESCKLKESDEHNASIELEKLVRDEIKKAKNSFPDIINYKGKDYKCFNVMSNNSKNGNTLVYYCNMENTPNGDPQESNDYFFINASLNPIENGFKGVREINYIEDLTESCSTKKSKRKLKESSNIIWTSETTEDDYDKEELEKNQYQDYLDNFDGTIQPMPYDEWLDSDWLGDYLYDDFNSEDNEYNEWYDFISNYPEDALKRYYQDYLDDIKNREPNKPKEFDSWFEDYVVDDADNQWTYKEDDLRENVLPMIDKQVNGAIFITGNYNSNYPEFRKSGPGGKIVTDGDDLINWLSNEDKVVFTNEDDNQIGVSAYDHDGSIGGLLFTLPEDPHKILEIAMSTNYYDETDYEDNDEIIDEFLNDLSYGNVSMHDIKKPELLVPIKNGFLITESTKTQDFINQVGTDNDAKRFAGISGDDMTLDQYMNYQNNLQNSRKKDISRYDITVSYWDRNYYPKEKTYIGRSIKDIAKKFIKAKETLDFKEISDYSDNLYELLNNSTYEDMEDYLEAIYNGADPESLVDHELDESVKVNKSKKDASVDTKFVYTNAESGDESDAKTMAEIQYKSEAPNLDFKVHKDGNMYYVDFIGSKKDISDYLKKLGWYTDEEIDKNDLIKPLAESKKPKKEKKEDKRVIMQQGNVTCFKENDNTYYVFENESDNEVEHNNEDSAMSDFMNRVGIDPNSELEEK